MPDQIFESLNQITPVSEDQYQRLSHYVDLIKKWQLSINLVSNNTIGDIWNRHIIDSLQLIPLIDNKNAKIIDLGSGAGLPGMVLAIMGFDVTMVESDQRKAIFLREVSRETKATSKIHNDRIENLKLSGDIITSRALGNVSQLFSWCQNFVSCETKSLFHKGKNYSMELDQANEKWQFNVKTHPSVTEKDAVILECSNIRSRENDRKIDL